MCDNNNMDKRTVTSATIEEFSRICRTCLSQNNLNPIFGTIIDNLEVGHLLSIFASIKVERNENLPTNICSTCMEELHRIHKFKKQCHVIDAMLKNLLDKAQLNPPDTEIEEAVVSKACNSTKTDKSVGNLLPNNSANVSCDESDHHGEVTCKIEEQYVSDAMSWAQTKPGNGSQKSDVLKMETADIKQRDISSDINSDSAETESIPHAICSEKFTLKNDHKGPYVCKMCDEKFSQNNCLLHHKKEHNLAKKTVAEHNETKSCQFCGQCHSDESRYLAKKYTHKSRFPQHKNNEGKGQKADQNSNEVDEEEQMYICYHCNKCFRTKRNLKRHLEWHGKKLFLCSVCGAECISSYKLQMHARIHTGERPYVCSVCKKSFRDFTTFHRHKRIHTGQKPYSCEFCGRQFTQRTHLNKHLKLHTGERPYACNLCEKVFIDNSSLTIHVRLHTGDRCFVCTICGKGYYDKSTRRKHMKQVHKVEEKVESLPESSQVADSSSSLSQIRN